MAFILTAVEVQPLIYLPITRRMGWRHRIGYLDDDPGDQVTARADIGNVSEAGLSGGSLAGTAPTTLIGNLLIMIVMSVVQRIFPDHV